MQRPCAEDDLTSQSGEYCLNQNAEAVQVIIANLVVPRRPTPGGAEANMSELVDPAGERVSSSVPPHDRRNSDG